MTDGGFVGAPPAVVDEHYRTNFRQGSRNLTNYFVYSMSVSSSVVPRVFACPPGNARPVPCSMSLFFNLGLGGRGRKSGGV